MGDGVVRGARLRDERDAVADADLDTLYARVLEDGDDVGAALRLAVDLGRAAPRPGSGRTLELWETLATIAAADLTAARVVEPHLDALAILGESGSDLATLEVDHDSTWGVFAAEGAGMRLSAVATTGEFRLSGTKPWCSLGGRLSHALVTAHVDSGTRRLFAVDLRHPGVEVSSGVWAARGLTGIPSGPIDFAGVPAQPVGADGWYLSRTGFAWGGIGVAAVWWGGAIGIARRMFEQGSARDPDQIALAHLGAVDADILTGRIALASAADAIDSGRDERHEAAIRADRTRLIIAGVVDDVIRRSAHSLGPSPLALEERHARRVADLGLYVRQHHAERDEAAVGSALLASRTAPW